VGFGDKPEEATVAVEAPRPAVLDDLDSWLVVPIKKFVGDLAGGSFVREFQSLRTEPLHAHDGDEAIGKDSLYGGTTSEVFESSHITALKEGK
jgi:hypothetical protein